MLFDQAIVGVAELEKSSGWQLKPEGLCQDDVCIPLPRSARRGDDLDLTILGQALGMPLVSDPEASLWALGPRSAEHALQSARAPDLMLPDVAGQPFALASLRGKKVLLLAWASW